MDPTTVCCPHVACPVRGQAGQRNIRLHARQDRRFRCTECHKTFTATQGTAFYRLRPSAETVTRVVTRMAHGCPRPASVVACGLDARTVASWLGRAGVQGHAVPQHLVEPPRALGEVPADAIRVTQHGGSVWMALALRVSLRVWRAGEVSDHRALPLRRRLLERVPAGARTRPLVCGTDGVCASVRAVRETFREAISRGTRGPPPLRAWPQVLIAQGVTRDEQRSVVAVERRIVQGAAARVEQIRDRSQGDGVIHTASSERLNATFRARLSSLTRRGRALARQTGTWSQGMSLMGTVSHCCTPHASVRWAKAAAGITDHGWSVRALRSFHGPPPRWIPPKRRGRPSRALQCLVERWCS